MSAITKNKSIFFFDNNKKKKIDMVEVTLITLIVK